jgi:hypothetical protein
MLAATFDEPRNRTTRPHLSDRTNPYKATAVVLFVASIYFSTELKNQFDGPDVILWNN